MTYHIAYWLPGQSELFSEPQHYVTEDKDSYVAALKVAAEHGYKVVFTEACSK